MASETLERDDKMGNQYRDDLIACPAFIAELALENEEAETIAVAMRTNNMRVIGLAFTNALYRAADEMIVTCAAELGTTPGEAAKRLYEAYRPDAAETQTQNESTPRLAGGHMNTANINGEMPASPVEVEA